MSTDVVYNGIVMHNVVTRWWSQTVRYDDSNTDRIYNEHKMRFEGIVHAQSDPNPTSENRITPDTASQVGQAPAFIAEGLLGDTHIIGTSGGGIDCLNNIRKKMSFPRKVLVIQMNNKTVLEAHPLDELFGSGGDPSASGSIYDVINGPKPSEVEVMHVANGRIFRVGFTIEVGLLDCEDSQAAILSPVLNNRWSIAEDLDENFFTKRVIRGKLVFSSAWVASHHPFVRALVIPRLENGFRRERIGFSVAPDGLTAEYEILDRQTHTAAPWPATKISGTHTEGTGDGVTMRSSCSVRLEGAPNTNKQHLITRAFQIIDNKLNILDQSGKATPLNRNYKVEQCEITDHFGQANVVSCSMRIQQVTDDPARWLANLRTTKLGKPIELPDLVWEPFNNNSEANSVPYDPAVSWEPAFHGYNPYGEPDAERDPTTLMLLRCFLQRPCQPFNDHAIWAGREGIPDPVEEDPTEVFEYQKGSLSDSIGAQDTENTSDPHRQAMFTLSKAKTEYFFTPVRAQMPIARTRASDADGDPIPPEELPTTIVWDLAPRQATMQFVYEAERMQIPPNIPDLPDKFFVGNITFTLIDSWVRSVPPANAVDQVAVIHTLHSGATYAMSRPPILADGKLPFGTLPDTKRSTLDNGLVIQTLLDPTLGPEIDARPPAITAEPA